MYLSALGTVPATSCFLCAERGRGWVGGRGCEMCLGRGRKIIGADK